MAVNKQLVAKFRKITGDIVAHRRNLNQNQSEFWARYGLSQSGGSRYESGRKLPKPVRLLIAMELGLSLDDANILLAKAANCGE